MSNSSETKIISLGKPWFSFLIFNKSLHIQRLLSTESLQNQGALQSKSSPVWF